MVLTGLGSKCLWSAYSHHLSPGLVGCRGVLSLCKTTQRYVSVVIYIPWGRISFVTVLSLNYCLSSYYYFCLTAFPLILHSLTSLISSCLSLLFGTWGTSGRLKPFFYKQDKGDKKGLLHWEGPARSCLISLWRKRNLLDWTKNSKTKPEQN